MGGDDGCGVVVVHGEEWWWIMVGVVEKTIRTTCEIFHKQSEKSFSGNFEKNEFMKFQKKIMKIQKKN